MSDSNFAKLLANLSPEKRAILAEMLRPSPEPVAVVGMGCRFPGGANNPELFWELLVNGRDAITPVPADRWPVDDYYDPNPAMAGKINSRYGAFLDQVDQFDAAFFGISPREAVRMDPQQRLFLEVAWEALEDAGQSQTMLAGSNTGVFAGVYQGDYSWFQFDDVDRIDAYVASGMSHAIVANRLSYLFDLKGPSLAVDTACSSSLVAFHLACQSLRHQECDMALAGGVNLILSPLFMLPVAKWGMLAPDGRCKTFDARADGMVRGEGCGVVVLKRLADARRDGDRILAICRGTAANQDGRTNALTAPNGLSQKEVIQRALKEAGLSGREIGYVEAHGTGTALGDPIEMEALVETVGQGRSPEQVCHVGSVKTNIGHLEAAAGIAGLIKVVLALQYKTIPSHLHFQELSPHINLVGVPVVIPTETQAWSAPDSQPRRAGISSFGFGGANAHAVLEEAEEIKDDADFTDFSSAKSAQSLTGNLLLFSAPQAGALPELAAAYRKRLADNQVALADICHAAARRRTHFNHRVAVACRSQEEARAVLDAYLAGADHPLLFRGRRLAGQVERLAFVYSGQGAQWAGMGQQLYAQDAVFRQKMDECDAALRPYLGRSLVTILSLDEDVGLLDQTAYAQPAIFALQVALTALWQSWGIQPAAVTGHSLGEITAAYTAGVLTLADAAKIIVERSRLMETVAGQGQMAAANLPSGEAQSYLAQYPQLALAAVNSPNSIVVSGDSEQLAVLLTEWQEAGIQTRLLPVNYAFHSPQVAPLAGQLARSLTGIRPQAAVIPLVSTVTGQTIQGEQMDAAYWGRNMSHPVLLAAAANSLINAGCTDFLEISSHPVLSHYLRQTLDAGGHSGSVTASLRRDREEMVTMLAHLGSLYASGYTVNWDGLYGRRGQFVSLPTYPWQRKRYWLDGAGHNRTPVAAAPLHPLLDRPISSPLLDGPLFEKQYTAQEPAFLGDHRIHGALIIPATAHLEMVTAAAKILFGPGHHRIQEMVVRQALPVPERGGVTAQLAFTAVQPNQSANFQIFARSDDSDAWQLYAEGRVSAGTDKLPEIAFDRAAIQARCPDELPGEAYYSQGEAIGAQFGPRFQPIRHLWRGENEALGLLQAQPVLAPEMAGYWLHPALADALFHIVYAARGETAVPEMFLPLTFDDVCYYGTPRGAVWCHFQLRSVAPDGAAMVGDARLFDSDGRLLAEASGVRYRRATKAATLARHLEQRVGNWLYRLEWLPQAPAAVQPVAAGTGWFILTDESGYGAALADNLQSRGYPAALVIGEPGAEFGLTGERHFTIDPGNPTHYQQLLASNWAQQMPAGYQIVHLTAVTQSESRQDTPEALAPLPELLQSALYLTQAAVRQAAVAPPRLWFVTRQTQAAGHEELNLTGAPLWGFGRSLAWEYPQLWGGLIDLDDRPPDEAAVLLAAELLQPDGEDQIAWRDWQRLAPRLTHLRLSEPASDETRPSVAAAATYLITGAFGAVGREIARWLAAQGARHLALLSRRGATPDDAPFLAELRASGVTVSVYAADVADWDQLTAVWSEITAAEQPLKGIFHTAGVVADGTIAQIEWSQFAAALAAKVDGAWYLHRLALDEPLDYFVLFSSGAAVLGSPGQSNYAAANGFMDALAHYRRQRQLPGLSLNWGPWDRGMAAVAGEKGQRRWQALGMGALSPEQALFALGRLLPLPGAQVAVLPLSPLSPDSPALEMMRQRPWLSRLAEQLVERRPSVPVNGAQSAGLLAGSSASANGRIRETFRDAMAQAPARRRKPMLAAYLREQLGQVLGWETDYEVDPQQGLFDVGLDSLMAMELKNRLERNLELARPLPFTLIFDYPTLASLADYLHDELMAAETAALMAAETAALAEPGDDLASLSEEDLLDLLAQEMDEK
jgi:myxalamid-type polyketide synthase MxaD